MATILIVDDRPANREFLVNLLGHGGHLLFEASDGAEALTIASAESPHLIISDILMPTMDGFELVRQLRADPALAAVPIIFCTAHYHEQAARQMANMCGASSVLLRPCDPDEVLWAVGTALGLTPPSEADLDRQHLQQVTDKLAQTAEELRAANHRLSALVDLGLRFASERDQQRLLRALCHGAREIVGARFALVGIVDLDGIKLHDFFTSGMDAATVARLALPGARPPALAGVIDGRSVRRANPGGDPATVGFPPGFPLVHSWLAAPITSPKRVYGWLCLIDKLGQDAFGEEDEKVAETVAAQVGRVYENGRLYAEAARHASDLEQEVAERKNLEARVRQGQQRLQDVIASSPAVLFTLAFEGEQIRGISWISDSLRKMLGYEPEDAMHADWWMQNIHPDDQDVVMTETHADLLATGRSSHEYRFRHRDGTYRWTRGDLRLMRDPAGRLMEAIGSWVDVTDRKRLEDQFRQSQKMEAVGRLAGGVAHDFNNLLTVIKGYGEILLSQILTSDSVRDLIKEMVAAGDRAAGLTRQLLAFSRQTIVNPRVMDLKALVIDLDKMLGRIIGEDVQLVTVVDPELGAVKADPGQLEQVLLNLIVNARDAMPTGGRLTVELHNTDLDETHVRTYVGARPGPHILLAVTDAGCGMDAATIAHVFEPFFTTKGEKGTGLGLATVFGIVQQSGGHVAVYSEVGHGTTFKVYLPRVDERPVAGRLLAAGGAGMPRGTETVLLAEDEVAVRALTRHVLKECGYTILEGRDGMDAVRVASEHRGRIDLLVTDVVMPRLGGRQTAERIRAACPELKVLFLSGYTDDAVVRHGILEAEVAFLQKPFSPIALSVKVREVLDS